MQTISDECLSTVSRVYQSKGRDVMALSVLGAFSFGDAENPSEFLPEAEVWGLAAPVLDSGLALEEGMAKPGREFFVAGSAYAPPGKKAQAVVASARVGDLERKLRVAGDRQWGKTGPGEAEAFTAMPIDWQHAWGGPNVPENPLGKGAADPAKNGRLQPLPNVFDPTEAPGAAGQRVTPASFLPVGSVWAARSDKPVTGDAAWLAHGGPGLPPDFDDSWFFTAHPDQRGAGQFGPGEPFAVTGMHPEKETVAGRIPLETPWARVERQTAEGVKAETVPLRLDTVWLFPDQEKGVLVWHGETAAGDDEASDVVALRSGFGEQPEEVMEPQEDEPPAEEPPPPPPPPPLPAPMEVEALAAELPEVVDVPVEAQPVAPVEVPVVEPAMTPEQRQAKFVADARENLHSLVDDFAAEPAMQNPGQELDIFNDVLRAKNLPPVDMNSYQQALAQRVADMHDAIDLIPDDTLLQSLPLDQRFAGIDEQGARNILFDDLTAKLNMSSSDAQSLVDKAFAPAELDFSKPMSSLLTNDLGVDLASMGADADFIDNQNANRPSEAEANAKIDKFMQDNLGTSFDAFKNQVEQGSVGIPLSTREDLANLLGNSELAEKMSPLLPLVRGGDATNAAQAVANASDALISPEDLEIRETILQKYLPQEDYAAYKQFRAEEPPAGAARKAAAARPQAAMTSKSDKPLSVDAKGAEVQGLKPLEADEAKKFIGADGKPLAFAPPEARVEAKMPLREGKGGFQEWSGFPEFKDNPQELQQWFGPDGKPLPGFEEYLQSKGISPDDPRLAVVEPEDSGQNLLPDPNAIPGPPGMDPLQPLPPPDDIFDDSSR